MTFTANVERGEEKKGERMGETDWPRQLSPSEGNSNKEDVKTSETRPTISSRGG